MSPSYPPEKKVEYWTKVFVLVSMMAGGAFGAWYRLGDVATDSELATHDDSKIAHPHLRALLEAQGDRYTALQAELKELNAANIELGKYYVSTTAADRELNRNYKAAAATFYRSEYMKLIRRHFSVKQAMEEALEAPWPTRPRF